MVTKLTDAMVAIEGEAMRQVTWVVIDEVKGGHGCLAASHSLRLMLRRCRPVKQPN